jgi:hypothetical protein
MSDRAVQENVPVKPSLFLKTKYCYFWQQGSCTRGEKCKFAHGSPELGSQPDLTKTAICTQWKAGACALTSDECSFAHGKQELRRFTQKQKRQCSSLGSGTKTGLSKLRQKGCAVAVEISIGVAPPTTECSQPPPELLPLPTFQAPRHDRPENSLCGLNPVKVQTLPARISPPPGLDEPMMVKPSAFTASTQARQQSSLDFLESETFCGSNSDTFMDSSSENGSPSSTPPSTPMYHVEHACAAFPQAFPETPCSPEPSTIRFYTADIRRNQPKSEVVDTARVFMCRGQGKPEGADAKLDASSLLARTSVDLVPAFCGSC